MTLLANASANGPSMWKMEIYLGNRDNEMKNILYLRTKIFPFIHLLLLLLLLDLIGKWILFSTFSIIFVWWHWIYFHVIWLVKFYLRWVITNSLANLYLILVTFFFEFYAVLPDVWIYPYKYGYLAPYGINVPGIFKNMDFSPIFVEIFLFFHKFLWFLRRSQFYWVKGVWRVSVASLITKCRNGKVDSL